MKSIHRFTYILLCTAMLLSSCSETLKESISDVILTKDHHGMNGGAGSNSWEDLKSIPAEGCDLSVKVIAEPSTAWTIQGLPNWLTATPSSGKGDAEVFFHAEKNANIDEARSAVLDLVSTIANWPVKKSYMVTQLGATKRINVYPDNDASYIFGANGGYRDIQISSNTSWKIKSLLSFCTLDKNEGTGDGVVRLTVSPYNTLDVSPRYAYIEVTDGNNATVKTIQVTQSPVSTTFSTQNKEVEISHLGDSKRLSDLGRVEGDYTASSSDASWLTVSQASNSGEIDVTISASANNSGNTREAYVYIYLKEEPSKALYAIKVTQTSSFLAVGSTSENFPAAGGTKNVSVSSSDDWNFSTEASWLSLSKSGDNLEIRATSNESLTVRNAMVSITNGIQTESIEINQDARVLTASNQTFSFDGGGGTKTYSFTTDANWAMSEACDWIKLSQYSGTGSSEVSIIVDPSNSTSPRTGYVYFECLGKKYTITISQSEKLVFEVSPTSLNFDAESSSRTLTITTNGAWSTRSKSGWVSISKESGNGDATIMVTAENNTGETKRDGNIIFKDAEGKEYIVALSQESSYLNASESPLTFKSTPSSQTLTLATNVGWTAESDVDWLSTDPSSGTGNATIKLSVLDNASAESRDGHLTIKNNVTGAAKVIAVTQLGKTLSFNGDDEKNITFKAGGGTENVPVTTDAPSTDISAVSSDTGWLTVTRNGNVLSVKTTANPTTSERKGTITVSLNGVSGLTRQITVTQAAGALSLSLSPQSLSFDDAGGVKTVNINTNGDLNDIVLDTSDPSWLTVSRSGEILAIEASANSTRKIREGSILVTFNSATNLTRKITVEQKAATTINGHEFVDLGFGVMWATCNIGAKEPEGYGYFYAWGDTETKSSYSHSNCFTSGQSISKLQDAGVIDSQNNLIQYYDAATANWGDPWRLPTRGEIQTLKDYCDWTWTQRNGVYGYWVKSKINGNGIFLPASGYREDAVLEKRNSYGRYLGATCGNDSYYNIYLFSLGFYSGGFSGSGVRYQGQSVRPVAK